jgi:hypothetical protein
MSVLIVGRKAKAVGIGMTEGMTAVGIGMAEDMTNPRMVGSEVITVPAAFKLAPYGIARPIDSRRSMSFGPRASASAGVPSYQPPWAIGSFMA